MNLRMKKIWGFILCLGAFIAVGCESDPTRFVLKGTLNPDDSNGKIYLRYAQGEEWVYDTATVSNGHFRFEGHVDAPVAAYLSDGQRREAIALYLTPATMEFSGTLSEPYRFTLTGSPMNDEYLEYVEKVLPLYKKGEALQQEMQKGGDAHKRLEALKQELLGIDREFIERPGSLYGVEVLKKYLGSFSPEQAEKYFNSYAEEGRKSSPGQEVAAEIQRAKRLLPGQPAPELVTADIDGKPFRLSDLRGKYIILDFWASWCVPCRASNPQLIKLWKKYHDKGLEIVCVADNDSMLDQWHEAIEKDGIGMFRHVLRGLKKKGDDFDRSGDLSKPYNIHSIPTKYLIDADGNIVGKMSTEEITAKLAEVFASAQLD